MKMLAVIATLALAGCASTQKIAKVEPAKGSTGVMLTRIAPDQLAACFAKILNTSSTPSPDGFSVSSGGEMGMTYQIKPFADPLQRYTTRVDIYGNVPPSREANPVICL